MTAPAHQLPLDARVLAIIGGAVGLVVSTLLDSYPNPSMTSTSPETTTRWGPLV